MLAALALSVFLIAVTVSFQGAAFSLIFKLTPGGENPEDVTLLAVVPAVFVIHLVNVLIFAVAYVWMQDRLGTIAGEGGKGFVDFLYLSLTSYTTVGFGDVYATGPMRMVVALESLTGLLLIGWSASFTYTVYQK